MEDFKPMMEDIIAIPDWLKDYESVFLWHSMEKRGLGIEYVILRILEKLDDLKIDQPNFSVQRFVSLLKLVLEYYIIDDLEKSWEAMDQIESLIEDEESKDDPLYENIKLSLGHVVSSTKACLLALDNQEDKARKLIANVIPIKLMADHEVAAVNAMRARFFLYSGYENGEDLGVKYARIALELEPDNPEWEYLLAKMLRQQRRDVPFSTEVPREELTLLESAVGRNKCSKYMVYLAQVYREAGSQAFRIYKNTPNFFNSDFFKSIESMGVKALNLYKEALALDPESPAMLRRIGYGIMNLPKKIADYDFAEKCLLASLEISPNQMTLHVLGTFYNRYRQDNKKALEYFEKTARLGSHAGISDMIRIKYLLDPSYDPCPDLDEGLKCKIKMKNTHYLLVQKGGYYLFIKRDYLKCLDCIRKVLSDTKDSPHLKSYKSLFLRMNDPINLYEYLINEGLRLINQVNSPTSQDNFASDEDYLNITENIGLIEEFIDEICEIHPELSNITSNVSLVEDLIKASIEISEKYKMRNTGNFHPGRYDNSNRNYKSGGYQSERSYHRGGNRGRFTRGRGNFRTREAENTDGPSSDNSCERRGRFSIANQRQTGNDDMVNRAGGFHKNKPENWRLPRKQTDQKSEKYEESPKSNEDNWRQK